MNGKTNWFVLNEKPPNIFCSVLFCEDAATYQADTKKENLKNSYNAGWANYVTVAHRRHGDHQKVNALPVTQLMDITKVRGVAAVLQLE